MGHKTLETLTQKNERKTNKPTKKCIHLEETKELSQQTKGCKERKEDKLDRGPGWKSWMRQR